MGFPYSIMTFSENIKILALLNNLKVIVIVKGFMRFYCMSCFKTNLNSGTLSLFIETCLVCYICYFEQGVIECVPYIIKIMDMPIAAIIFSTSVNTSYSFNGESITAINLLKIAQFQ